MGTSKQLLKQTEMSKIINKLMNNNFWSQGFQNYFQQKIHYHLLQKFIYNEFFYDSDIGTQEHVEYLRIELIISLNTYLKQQSLEFLIYNQLLKKFSMKAKQSHLKQINFQVQINEFSIEQSLHSQFDNKKSKTDKIKVDPTVASLSQNQISNSFLSLKHKKCSQNDDSVQEQNILNKKQRKLNKKRIIEKIIILRTRDRNGKSNRIKKNFQAYKQKSKQRKAQKLKQKIKQIKKNQKIIPSTTQTITIQQKVPKLVKKEQKEQKLILDDYAEIKMIGFERKQLQKKRNDLLKRQVQDWSFMQKGRSQVRQLRSLNI